MEAAVAMAVCEAEAPELRHGLLEELAETLERLREET